MRKLNPGPIPTAALRQGVGLDICVKRISTPAFKSRRAARACQTVQRARAEAMPPGAHSGAAIRYQIARAATDPAYRLDLDLEQLARIVSGYEARGRLLRALLLERGRAPRVPWDRADTVDAVATGLAVIAIVAVALLAFGAP